MEVVKIPTTLTGTKVEEFHYKNGMINIMQTPMTRFGVLYFPTYEPKEQDKSLGNYKVNAFSTIDEAKKHGRKIADGYIKNRSKKKNKSIER